MAAYRIVCLDPERMRSVCAAPYVKKIQAARYAENNRKAYDWADQLAKARSTFIPPLPHRAGGTGRGPPGAG